MATWSKTLNCSCYELGHTWTPYCTQAFKDVCTRGFLYSFKIYGPLYLVAAILRRKNKEYFLKKLLPEILQSTLFLGTNAVLFMGGFCLWRRIVGFYFFFNVFPCAMPAPALALLVERKDRRGMLALYVSNLAIETLYRMAEARGYVRQIKNGQVILFSIVSSIYLYLYRQKSGLEKSTLNFIKLLLGGEESPDLLSEARTIKSTSSQVYHNVLRLPEAMWQRLLQLVQKWRQGPRHHLCKHLHGCHSYCIEGFLRSFTMGYIVQAAVGCFTALPKLTKQPSSLLQALKHRNNFSLGAFLGLFTAVFRMVNCVLRWLRDTDHAIHGAVAGFLASWSMLFYKSTSVALYLATKITEILYFKGIKKGWVPHIKCGDILLYSISTSILFHATVFEAHSIRPAYWRWLLKITGGKFAMINRKLLDIYGTQASKLYPDFVPKLDPRFSEMARKALLEGKS
ncbi:transmembrane protein 135 isoform X2 [Lingula anatina]|uniref:Transmembrane protein 135 isoform X2 n=1 Tax=Lingula anatina TaxID=7574 RepID=A0A1S3KAX9_LINAN|nr:transmembrane protein 135 isoform X2 [Lingula anatina]|eukprot:XP_013419785.1 transmembrane protein 135 isoform X2 [Lingula anatina]